MNYVEIATSGFRISEARIPPSKLGDFVFSKLSRSWRPCHNFWFFIYFYVVAKLKDTFCLSISMYIIRSKVFETIPFKSKFYIVDQIYSFKVGP